MVAEITALAKGTPQSLTDFRQGISEQISAIFAAGREILDNGSGAEMPTGVRVELSVGPDPAESSAANRSVECWDHTYVCGKSTSGYIYCTNRVCMIV